MALHNETAMRVEAGAVERVRNLSHKTPSGPNRQARIRIQRYDIADADGKPRHTTSGRDKRRIGVSAKQSIELV
jgi:hypothetical protein